jgi:hypothetical protein
MLADDWDDEPTSPSLPGQPVPHKVEHSFALVCKTRLFDLSEVVPIFVDDSGWTDNGSALQGADARGTAAKGGASRGWARRRNACRG